jgi:subtilisin family serine protease
MSSFHFIRTLVVGIAALSSTLVGYAQNIEELSLSKQVLLADPDLKYDPYTVLVRFRADASEAARDAAVQLVGGTVLERYTLVPDLMQIEVSGSVETAITKLSQLKSVEYAEFNYVLHADALIPNDPGFSQCWGMLNTGQTINSVPVDPGVAGADARATDAWSVRTGDPSFVIAVIDSGTLVTHPDLAANIWVNPGEIAGNGIDDDANGFIDDVNGWDFFSRDNNPSDPGHGTHTAGTIGAVGNNGIGVAGVAWQCKIMPVRFLGPAGGLLTDGILAIQYVAGKGVKVSNNSWGGGPFMQSLFDAIAATRAIGHVFVASAGNNSQNSDLFPAYPAAYNLDNIISVAATDNNDGRASFSNYGPISCDIGASGVNILSTYDVGYAYMSGTSMAGPHVAGAVALVYMQNPTFTYAQVKNQILATSRPVASLSGLCVTGGVLNIAAALGVVAPPVNRAPVVTITSPTAGAAFSTGTAITFTGSATDAEDGDRTASLVWTSNLQGQIGVGATFIVSNLAAGTHTITARATDTAGLAGTLTRSISVTAPVAPTTPTGLRLTRTVNTVSVSWTDRSNNESGFQIRREQRVAGVWMNIITVGSVAANIVSFLNTGVPTGEYRYSVRAVNGVTASVWTGWSSIVVP